MGLAAWFKQKFNIGGLKIRIIDVEPIKQEQGIVTGNAAYSSKTLPMYAHLTYRLVCETTTGKGNEKKTQKSTIAEMKHLLGVSLDGTESVTQPFLLEYDLRSWHEKQGGMVGAAGKFLKFAADTLGDKGQTEYYVEIEGSIPGTWFGPSDRKPIAVHVAT